MASGPLGWEGVGVDLARARGGRRADMGGARRKRALGLGLGYDGVVKEGKATYYLHGVYISPVAVAVCPAGVGVLSVA